MFEKTKRSRSIYTVNEKTTEVTPQTPIIKQIKQEATSPSQERKVKDYTPEWRKIPSVGSFGDFDRGVDNAKLVYPEPIPGNVYYSNSNTDFLKPGMAVATPHGTMSLRLRNDIKVDMSLDCSIRVTNKRNNVVIALNPHGCTSAFLHPHGRIYQNGSKVEMLVFDSVSGNNKMAKMWYKGVSFKSDFSALVYLVDAAGTRSTTDSFRDLSPDFSLSVFYDESRHGPIYVQETVSTLQKATYWMTQTGVEHWKIKDMIITQDGDVVNIYRKNNKYQLKTGNCPSAMLSTPFIHCTASAEHMFVRRGDRRMHFDGCNFIVRNAGHSAGFDEANNLKIF
ncbi:uncharacterized protein LOC103513660 isoform X1 [Diaphorina citri]|uniref:Uncharacterized protein LOC103513660 isoform X1 n=1 Tax=Diaphorina citri TaxID=121845 RepID=A0A1S3D8X2_DIACI|nr:uncharacterized protein LOC103513660 isoform X1 [Diaphorina citri]